MYMLYKIIAHAAGHSSTAGLQQTTVHTSQHIVQQPTPAAAYSRLVDVPREVKSSHIPANVFFFFYDTKNAAKPHHQNTSEKEPPARALQKSTTIAIYCLERNAR